MRRAGFVLCLSALTAACMGPDVPRTGAAPEPAPQTGISVSGSARIGVVKGG